MDKYLIKILLIQDGLKKVELLILQISNTFNNKFNGGTKRYGHHS